mmetsp:Transcript_19255/g.41136  ORF Transcript_19255/g.41136 Transcript_19255/m.41136 type:complete len:83 (+) Transcript_19255:149-397(+)
MAINMAGLMLTSKAEIGEGHPPSNEHQNIPSFLKREQNNHSLIETWNEAFVIEVSSWVNLVSENTASCDAFHLETVISCLEN